MVDNITSTPVHITICVSGKYSPVTVVDRCSVGPEEVALRRMRERALVELVVREPDPARIRETRVVRPLPGVRERHGLAQALEHLPLRFAVHRCQVPEKGSLRAQRLRGRLRDDLADRDVVAR